MNPLAGFKTVSGDRDALSRVVANTELFLDLRDGSLPPVSWVLPNAEESEHPMTDVRVGMWYVTAVANALMKSPYWLNSVLVVTWDEYGGFFDHVPPPRVDGDGYGMRVPALIVSPYARQAVIDHTLYDFASILRFIENRFGLEPLAERDRKANDLGSALDLTQAPLEPFLIRGP
jgi:phospholipase C